MNTVPTGSKPVPVKWKTLRRTILLSLALTTLSLAALSLSLYGLGGGVITFLGSLCLASGFWLTEGLVGVMTGTKRANPTAIALLFLGKIAWWVALFVLSRKLPTGMEVPVALGVGAFLLALLAGAISLFGWPKMTEVSDGKGAGEP